MGELRFEIGGIKRRELKRLQSPLGWRRCRHLQHMFSVQLQPATPTSPYVHTPWGYQTHLNPSNPLPPPAYVSGFQNVYQVTYSAQSNPYLDVIITNYNLTLFALYSQLSCIILTLFRYLLPGRTYR